MKFLDLNKYYYHKDNFLHILPKIYSKWLIDFFTYCKNYRDIWYQLLNLPVHINVMKYELWAEIKLQDFDDVIKLVHDYDIPFSIKKLWESESYVTYQSTLWFYIFFNMFEWSDSEFARKIFRSFLWWFYIKVKPQKQIWKKLLNTLFVNNMNLDDYDLNDNPLKIEASKQIYKNLFLYNALRETWEDEISLISLIDFSSLDRYDLLSENKYTIEMYNEFNRQTVKDFNLKIPNTIWDYFKLEVDDDPLLILWYIIFNEFILWKHSYLCYKNNYYDDFIIADESNIIKTLSYHSQTFCMSFANNYNIKLDNIESLNTVKQLRDRFNKWDDISKDNGWEKDLIEEIKLICDNTDSSVIEIEIKKKNIQSSRARFHVNDISRIQEMKDFVRDNWWVHIQNYKWSKSHIEWDRFKFFWDKKSKKSWNW